jgi:hypothetical protein
MLMAKIFAPIRHPAASTEAGDPLPPPSPAPDVVGDRDSRVGGQPVTNTPPSGPVLPDPAAAMEETWLSILELVFAETGWPDA